MPRDMPPYRLKDHDQFWNRIQDSITPREGERSLGDDIRHARFTADGRRAVETYLDGIAGFTHSLMIQSGTITADPETGNVFAALLGSRPGFHRGQYELTFATHDGVIVKLYFALGGMRFEEDGHAPNERHMVAHIRCWFGEIITTTVHPHVPTFTEQWANYTETPFDRELLAHETGEPL